MSVITFSSSIPPRVTKKYPVRCWLPRMAFAGTVTVDQRCLLANRFEIGLPAPLLYAAKLDSAPVVVGVLTTVCMAIDGTDGVVNGKGFLLNSMVEHECWPCIDLERLTASSFATDDDVLFMDDWKLMAVTLRPLAFGEPGGPAWDVGQMRTVPELTDDELHEEIARW